MSNEVNEKEKLKTLLVKIMLSPNWVDNYEDYDYYNKYKMHMTHTGLLHHKGYVKYGLNGNMVNPNYVITERGKKWLDKFNKGENDGTNK
jgi:hypothetical protein